MKVKLLVGIALFLFGLVTAALGIVSIGAIGDRPLIATEDNVGNELRHSLQYFVLPAIAGLSLAIGALLIGLSMGNWTHPRTHLEPGDKVVNPEGYHKIKHV